MTEETEPERLDWSAAIDQLEGAYAPKTLSEYRRDLATFVAWCRTAGVEALPASGANLARFVTQDLASCKFRTVKRRLAAIRRVHRVLGLKDAIDDEAVRLALLRGLRDRRHRPKQAHGLNAKLRDALITACPPTLKGLRDRALISVGYDTLCRRSELCALRLEDLTSMSDRTARVVIGQAKNDQRGEGHYAYISRRGLAHLEAWLEAARITEGPMFRPTFKVSVATKPLHPRAVNRVLQDAARLAGIDDELARQLSGHSMRVGAAQDLAAAGKSVLQIMRAGRWTHVEAVEAYVRKADVNVWAEVS